MTNMDSIHFIDLPKGKVVSCTGLMSDPDIAILNKSVNKEV